MYRVTILRAPPEGPGRSFNVMESGRIWSFTDNCGIRSKGAPVRPYVLQRAASERADYVQDKVGNSSASSRGSLQQALPAFGAGCPLLSPTLSVRASRFRTGRDHIKATVGRALSTIRRALPSFVTPQPI